MRGSARSASDQHRLAAAKPARSLIKRAIDITGSAVTLFFIAPLFLLTAFVIRLHDGGPVFYGHRRLGLAGAEFTCWKFRTMAVNSEQLLADYIARDESARREWEACRKLKKDPRVTPVGRLLRATSLDELPQLWNVLRGDMSLVGPRPIVSEEISRYGADYEHYVSLRPGITGLWQVSGRSDTSYRDRISLDRDYAMRWSLTRDLSILMMTIPAVFFQRGSY